MEPDLHAFACRQTPALTGLLQDLTAHFPYQEQPLPGEWGPYCRPRQHWRAFYYKMDEGALAFKGGEAHSHDFSGMLDVMVRQSATLSYSLARPGAVHRHNLALLSVLERFLFVENKFPGVVLLSEALAEAERAREFQRAYFGRHGRLARVPLPLLVHRIEESRTQSLVDQVCARVSAESQPRVRALGQGGLGLLIYWYPQIPLRVGHLDLPGLSADFSLRARLAALSHGRSPQEVVESWVGLLAEMLGLGYVPCDPLASLSGMCVEAHNLTLDGGMVDLDSLRPLASFRSSAQAVVAIERSLEILNLSIADFLLGDRGATPPSAALRTQVLAHCRQQQASGVCLTEPLARWLGAQNSAFEAMTLSAECIWG